MPRYQLSLHAENLPRGFFRKPNPYAVVKVSGGPREGEKIGQTEVMMNTRDPDWSTVMFVETDASVFLPLHVSILSDRKNSTDVLVETSFEATEIAQSPGHHKVREERGAKIIATLETSQKGNSSGIVTYQMRGLDIKNVEPGLLGLGRSDPFFELSRKNVDHKAGYVRWNVVHRSKHINDHLNPFWLPFTLSLEKICYDDLQWPLRVQVLDYEANGRHRVIGQLETTVTDLVERVSLRGNADRERAFEIFAPESNKTRGLLCITRAELQLEDIEGAAAQTQQ